MSSVEIPRPSSPNASEALDSGPCPQEFWHQNPETVSPCDWVNGSPLCILLSSQGGQNKPEAENQHCPATGVGAPTNDPRILQPASSSSVLPSPRTLSIHSLPITLLHPGPKDNHVASWLKNHHRVKSIQLSLVSDASLIMDQTSHPHSFPHIF